MAPPILPPANEQQAAADELDRLHKLLEIVGKDMAKMAAGAAAAGKAALGTSSGGWGQGAAQAALKALFGSLEIF